MKGTRGKHWQKGELAAIASELLQRLEIARKTGRPLTVDWPVDKDISLATRRLYAVLDVRIRFVPLTDEAPRGTVPVSPKE